MNFFLPPPQKGDVKTLSDQSKELKKIPRDFYRPKRKMPQLMQLIRYISKSKVYGSSDFFEIPSKFIIEIQAFLKRGFKKMQLIIESLLQNLFLFSIRRSLFIYFIF